MSIVLAKYHGLGNDYLIYDPEKNSPELTGERVKLLCDRHFGVGADGIMFGPIRTEDGGISVRIFNPDGSEAEAGGNGVRIFARYLRDEGYVSGSSFSFLTPSGKADIECIDGNGMIKVSVGTSDFSSAALNASGEEREMIGEKMVLGGLDYYVTCLSIGNPHCVIPMEHISSQLACEIGQCIESSNRFSSGVNTQLMQVRDRSNIDIEIYERGAGYTLASGSGSAAAASAAFKLGLTDNKVSVHMPGGTLEVEIADDGNVFITGPVEEIGTFTLSGGLEKKLEEL